MGKLKQEACENCVHRRGPIVLMCGSPHSEFYGDPVHPLGYCARYTPDADRRAALSRTKEG